MDLTLPIDYERVRQHQSSDIGDTALMTLDRNPFVAAAMEDVQASRTRLVTVRDLLLDSEGGNLPLDESHLLTDTFWSLWTHIPLSGGTRETILSVMRGIVIEPRHPAYRVVPLTVETLFRSDVGDATLVFQQRTDDITWLAVLHQPPND